METALKDFQEIEALVQTREKFELENGRERV